MKHRVKGKKLGRNITHRKALFKNLIIALITHGEIKTTEAKAKSIKRLVDKLITRAKKGTVHSRRLLGSFLHDKKAVNKLVDEIAPGFKDRTSGFTRIVKLGRRRGDDSMVANIELVGSQTSLKSIKSKSKKSAKPKSKTQAHQPKSKTQSKLKLPQTHQIKKQTTPRTTHK